MGRPQPSPERSFSTGEGARLQPALDGREALFKAIHTAVDGGEIGRDQRHPDLEVVEVLRHALGPLVDLAQERECQMRDVGLLCHEFIIKEMKAARLVIAGQQR